MILVLMGVSGIGKTTIGKLLCERTGWHFEDADEYHPTVNKQKMASGIPLTDNDRWPWLITLHHRMRLYHLEGRSVVLACSALKETYRERLACGFTDDEFRFIHLHAPVDVVRQRIQQRDHEYMNPQLFDSQLATLEKPHHAWSISVLGKPEEAIEAIMEHLQTERLLSAAKEKQ